METESLITKYKIKISTSYLPLLLRAEGGEKTKIGLKHKFVP